MSRLLTPDLTRVRPHGWTPDGTAVIAALSRGKRTNQIAVVSANSAGIRILRTVVSLDPQNMAVSPDGRWVAYQYIAYAVRRAGNIQSAAPEDIIVRSVKRGNVQRLSPRMSRIDGIYWFNDGRSVLLRGKDEKERAGRRKLRPHT